MHFYHQRHLCLSVLCAEKLCHTDGHVWSAKRRYNAHLLSYLGEEMWPNCLKYRQGRSVSCAGFCSVKIRNHLFVDFLATPERVQRETSKCKQNRRVKKKRGFFFLWVCGGVICGANLTLTNAPILSCPHGVTLHH